MTSNNAIIYKAAPTNYPEDGVHLAFEKRPFNLEELKLNKDEFVTENLYVSIDPYQRGKMRAPEVKSYSPAYAVGSALNNGGVGRVVKSNNEKYKVGVIVFGNLEWAEYNVVSAEAAPNYRIVENKHNLPLSNYVGILGMPGMTAYTSFYEIGRAKKGETFFVSAASGAVGQAVGQIAKREGLYVVGSAGSDDKVQYLKEIGFDAAFNYKTENIAEALAKYCPKGVDIYFDNVGGETLEAVINAANTHARFIMCGMISQYNTPEKYGIKNLVQVVGKRLLLQGFIVSDLAPKYAQEFSENVEKWLHEGSIKYREDIADGLEKGAAAFVDMLHGRNFGKAMIGIKGKHSK
jgi:NADPH-dependent curcumin reductase CurA